MRESTGKVAGAKIFLPKRLREMRVILQKLLGIGYASVSL